MKHRFLEPIRLGNQEVKNRVIYLAMAKTLSGFDNKVSRKDVAYIASIAKGGTGLIVTGAMIVDDEWPSVLPMQPAIYDDRFLPGLKQMVDAAHKNGAKIIFQLWHPGAVRYSSAQPPEINDLTIEDIHRIQGKYGSAAKRAMEAGADGVEFQMCHTYLANQFMSPLWNRRTDQYGCDTIENGARFATETLKILRDIIGPNKILSVKLQGFDYPKGEGPNGQDGIQPEMAAEYAKCAQSAGADLITVSGGGTLTGRDNIMSGDVCRKEGWKVEAAKVVKAAVTIPVAASDNIRHPEYVDQIMDEGIDMVGMARGLFAEHDWVNKCAEGREKELRCCISCMSCWNLNPFAPDQSNCSVNPFARRENSIRPLKQDGNGRVVAIIGAGPAGMEAAVTLKQRGFEPVVFEKSDQIGGMVNVAKKPPFKDKFDWMCTYYKNMTEVLKIDVRLNTEATVENVLSLNPYSVLVAAGSLVTTPPIKGLEKATALQSRDILGNDMVFENQNVVIVGGGITGLETALYLEEQGNTVAVVDMLPEFPMVNNGDPRYTIEAALETTRCKEKNIGLYYSCKVLDYQDQNINIENVDDGKQTALPADIVVLSTGVKPNDRLYHDLQKAGHPSVWKVGDANICAKIVNAVEAGSKFAYALT